MVKRYSNTKYGGEYCDEAFIKLNIETACKGLGGKKLEECAQNIRASCEEKPRSVTHGLTKPSEPKDCCDEACIEKSCKDNPRTSVGPYLKQCVDRKKKECESAGGKRKSVKKPKNKRKRNTRKSIKSMFSKMFR